VRKFMPEEGESPISGGLGERVMRKLWFAVGICGVFVLGSVLGLGKLGEFKAKAPNIVEKTKAAVESAAFKELQRELKESRMTAKFLPEAAYTAKFLNAKDKKDYVLTVVPMVSYFQRAAPPLSALIISNGEEFRAGSLKVTRDRSRDLTCTLQTSGGKVIAKAETMELINDTLLGLPRGQAAIAIAKNPEGDERVLVVCRSPHPAKRERDKECLGVVFYSGDLAWEKFAPAGETKPE